MIIIFLVDFLRVCMKLANMIVCRCHLRLEFYEIKCIQ